MRLFALYLAVAALAAFLVLGSVWLGKWAARTSGLPTQIEYRYILDGCGGGVPVTPVMPQ